MHIYLGADHGGFKLKEELKHHLLMNFQDLEVEDCGAFTYQAEDDYPQFAFDVAQKTVAALGTRQEALGVLLCRSGSGVVIAANKVRGARAVELYHDQVARHAKSHNQANVIAFAGDYLSLSEMTRLLEVFLQADIDDHPRHKRRLQQITSFEQGAPMAQ